MRRWGYILLLCLPAIQAMAEQNPVDRLVADATALGGTPEIVAEEGAYTKIRIADSCYVETYHYGDSILLVQTVCAPLCSSVAQMYDADWHLLHAVPAPAGYTLPQSVLEEGVLTWRENYAEEEEML